MSSTLDKCLSGTNPLPLSSSSELGHMYMYLHVFRLTWGDEPSGQHCSLVCSQLRYEAGLGLCLQSGPLQTFLLINEQSPVQTMPLQDTIHMWVDLSCCLSPPKSPYVMVDSTLASNREDSGGHLSVHSLAK